MERIVEGANPLSVRLSKYIEQRVYARSDRFITLSQYMKQILVDTYGIHEARVTIIPGGVNVDHFKQSISRREARSQLGLPLDRPYHIDGEEIRETNGASQPHRGDDVMS